MLDMSRKRMRDDDEDELASAHDTKRIHSMLLPFRTSPSFKHTRLFSQSRRHTPKPLFTQTVTPADSEEEMSPPFPPVSNIPIPEIVQCSAIRGEDIDVEMDLSSPRQPHTPRHLDSPTGIPSPKASPFTLLSPRTSKTSISNTGNGGRLPTPIYGHFQQSLDTKMEEIPHQSQTTSILDNEYEKAMRARRLPTPISEDEAMDVFECPTQEANVVSYSLLREPAHMVPPSQYQSAKRGKPMFSMGFRADCQMCRSRVPGHYNHISRA